MPNPLQLKIPATYMRGGTSKGVFFNKDDLPSYAQQGGPERDALLLRIMGSPDPYGKHIDGMGGGTSSTSKVVIVSKSDRPNHDVDYLFGQVAIDKAVIDWTGNCGNLTAAVGVFAVQQGLLAQKALPQAGPAEVRIWQANIEKTIILTLPLVNHQVQEIGDFYLDGVAFAAPEISLDFLDPSDQGALFPTGKLVERLSVPDVGDFDVTLINAGIATVFLRAKNLGYDGTELQSQINGDAKALARFEKIRTYAALQMGLIASAEEAKARQHTPKIAFVAPAKTYCAASGKTINAPQIDLVVRALSMGQLHHAMMGTAAVAIGAAGVIPGTLVNEAAGGGKLDSIIFGHPSGTLKVGAVAVLRQGIWQVERVSMSRSARVLMKGDVYVPSI